MFALKIHFLLGFDPMQVVQILIDLISTEKINKHINKYDNNHTNVI